MPRIPAIYLDVGDVVMWNRPEKRPPKKGRVGLYTHDTHLRPNVSTEIIGEMGIDNVREEVGDYRVEGSAAKYLARIRRLDRENSTLDPGEDFGRDPQRVIIFSGGIQIYKDGIIPGTEIECYELERHGRIWTAKSATKLYKVVNDGDLYRLIFGKANTKEGMTRRIKGILRAYEAQERAREEARSKAMHDNYQRGRGDESEAAHGTFGWRW